MVPPDERDGDRHSPAPSLDQLDDGILHALLAVDEVAQHDDAVGLRPPNDGLEAFQALLALVDGGLHLIDGHGLTRAHHVRGVKVAMGGDDHLLAEARRRLERVNVLCEAAQQQPVVIQRLEQPMGWCGCKIVGPHLAREPIEGLRPALEEAYVEDVNLDEGDEIINDLGQVAVVSREGNLSRHVGDGRLVYATQSRLLRSTSDVSSAPEIENVHKKIDNDRLSEIYEYTSLVSTYINSVIRCCDELASMPVEYPIVTDIIRLHRRMGYDRAADLLSELMFDDYESVSESESSYESMLAEHTKTLQVKVVT